MLRHVGVRMTEDSLGVFEAEFFPHSMPDRVPQLVRNPAVNLQLLACARNRSPVPVPCDPEQLRVGIGRQIFRQDYLSLGTEVEGSTLAMMLRLVIRQCCHPNIAGPVNHARGEFEQFSASSARQPLDVDQIANQR